MSQAARELYDRARTMLLEHRPDRADVLLREAEAACGADDDELRLRIAISATWVTFDRDGLAPAIAQVAAARLAARRAGLDEVAALAAVQTGTLYARVGDLPQAWRELSRVNEDALPPRDLTALLLNRGTIAAQVQRLDAAAGDLRRAAELAADSGAGQLAFMAQHNLGWAQFLRGDLPAALREMHAADDMDISLDRSEARLDRARVLLEAGLPADAQRLLLQVRDARLPAHQAAEVDLSLARCALLLGDTRTARERAGAAARVFKRRNEPGWERQAAVIRVQAGPRTTAARSLWAQAHAAGDRWVAARAAALALMAAAHPGSARHADLVRDATALTRSPTVSLRLSGLVALARTAADSGDAAKARRLLRRASDVLQRAQLGIASLDLRAAAALHGLAAGDLDLELAAPLGPQAMVDTMERWRAATRPVPRLTPPPDDRVADAASRLRQLRAEFVPDAPDAHARRRAIDEAEQHLRALTWGASTELPPTAQVVGVKALKRAAVARRATLVVTFALRDEFSGVVDVSAIVLGDHPTRMVRLGTAAALTRAVDAVHADLTASANVSRAHPLSGAVRASLRVSLQALSDLLIAPLGPLAEQLVVVPTAVLSAVPWQALPALRGVPVMASPTASSWVTAASVVPAPLVAVLTGPELPFAAQESAGVAKHWATVGTAGLADALEQADLVHVIAHGRHRSDNPLFSNLLLDGGMVVAHELERVSLRASHLVMSACEVGRSTHRPGEQPLGLTALALSGGVANVVSPVARVNDELAATVMGAYHAELATGADAAVALCAAVDSDAVDGDPAAGAFVSFGAPWRAVRA
ncbi:CHAT domain-containing protein [Propionibacteriaceae bacterium G57]|uniref:CHAT domain-containing protein n=1 Tax=Aestuariimicrobium sp. G57 TaxID=3418485 RepID=UPI003DA70166